MLIRVSKKHWVLAEDITHIDIVAATQIEHPETKFSVEINTDDNNYIELFTSFEDAEQFAAKLVNQINSGKWY